MVLINENSFGETLKMKIDKQKQLVEFFVTDCDVLGNERTTKTKTISFDFLTGM